MKKLLIVILIITIAIFSISCTKKTSEKVSEKTKSDLKSEIKTELKGHKITFASQGKSNSCDIWIADVDGKNEKKLTDGKNGVDMYPEWDAKAEYIYYTSNKHGGTMELYRVNAIGNPESVQLSLFGREVRSLSISADNKYIALGIMTSDAPFGSDLKNYSADLFILEMKDLDLAMKENRLLTVDNLRVLLSEPQKKHIWFEQPDFQKNIYKDELPMLSFVRTENYDNDAIMKDTIWTIRIDGSDLTKISDGSMPRWTANDRSLVTHGFNVIDYASKDVKKLKIDGLSSDAGASSISPDGKYVIFETSDQSRKAGYARVQYTGDTKNNPVIQFSSRVAYEPRWSPVPVRGKK